MGLTRSMLKGMGLTEEQVSAIIESHIETVDALKEERNTYKEKAEELKGVKKELDDLKKEGGEWQEKYEKEHSNFEAYKTEIEKKDSAQQLEKAYKALLAECGVDDKRIASVLKVSKLDGFELDNDGNIKNCDALKESIKNEWSDFIVTTETSGANTQTPPATNPRGDNELAGLSIEEYIAKRSKQ